jgi:hypothetical protein
LASASLDSRLGNSLDCSPSTINPKPSSGAAAFVPIANQTGFHATTAVKARRPCSRIGSSLPFGQTRGQTCVLRRAMFATGGQACGGDRRYPFVGSLTVAACSARLQVELEYNLLRRSHPTHQHHKASTHSARKETLRLQTRFHSGGLGVRKINEFIAHSLDSVPGTFDFSRHQRGLTRLISS